MMRNYIRFIVYLAVTVCLSSARADSYVDFFRALQIDNDSTVAELLQRGFDPNSRNEKGQPALLLTMRDEAFKSAALLLAQPQLEVDATNAAKETALMMAAIKGHTAWCARLIERGAKVNREGWSPLHYAATGPRSEAVALLLDRGATIDSRAPNGNTPLMMAARYGTEDSVRLLLARGADLRLRNDRQLDAAALARADGREWLAEILERAAR
jgi:uncharacterized protein